MTSETWHVTCDRKHRTHRVWWTFCENFMSLVFTAWEWLKRGIWEVIVLTIENLFLCLWEHKVTKRLKGDQYWVQVVSKCIIHPPGKYTTTWLVSKFSIISKSTFFCWNYIYTVICLISEMSQTPVMALLYKFQKSNSSIVNRFLSVCLLRNDFFF